MEEKKSYEFQVVPSLSLKEYYGRLFSDFRKHVKKIRRKPGKGIIHKLRLDVKKIRSVLNFINHMQTGDPVAATHFRLFRKIFNSAGRVRTLQMNLSNARKLDEPILKDYLKFHRKSMRKELNSLNKGIRSFKMKKLKRENEKLAELLSGIPLKTIMDTGKSFLSEKLLAINNIIAGMKSHEELHDLRKEMKTFTEIIRMLEDIEIREYSHFDQDGLKALTEELGSWHDYDVLIESFEAYSREIENEELRRAWKNLIANLKRKNTIAGKQIKNRISEFFGVMEISYSEN